MCRWSGDVCQLAYRKEEECRNNSAPSFLDGLHLAARAGESLTTAICEIEFKLFFVNTCCNWCQWQFIALLVLCTALRHLSKAAMTTLILTQMCLCCCLMPRRVCHIYIYIYILAAPAGGTLLDLGPDLEYRSWASGLHWPQFTINCIYKLSCLISLFTNISVILDAHRGSSISFSRDIIFALCSQTDRCVCSFLHISILFTIFVLNNGARSCRRSKKACACSY